MCVLSAPHHRLMHAGMWERLCESHLVCNSLTFPPFPPPPRLPGSLSVTTSNAGHLSRTHTSFSSTSVARGKLHPHLSGPPVCPPLSPWFSLSLSLYFSLSPSAFILPSVSLSLSFSFTLSLFHLLFLPCYLIADWMLLFVVSWWKITFNGPLHLSVPH